MTTLLTLKLDDRVLQRYTQAARRLRRTLGAEAPTTEQLMAYELSDRAAELIVEEFREGRRKRRRR